MTHSDNDRDYLNQCRMRCGMGWIGKPPQSAYEYESLMKTEWVPEFESAMRSRLVIGALRYGLLADNKNTGWRRMDSIRRRLERFSEDGNLEHLVDVANLSMLEFYDRKKHGAILRGTDDGEHVERHTRGKTMNKHDEKGC